MHVGQKTVLANLGGCKAGLCAVEPHTADRGQVGVRVADTRCGETNLDIRGCKRHFLKIRGNQVIPSLQCERGDRLLGGVQPGKSSALGCSIHT